MLFKISFSLMGFNLSVMADMSLKNKSYAYAEEEVMSVASSFIIRRSLWDHLLKLPSNSACGHESV